jgi:acyl carrier protein
MTAGTTNKVIAVIANELGVTVDRCTIETQLSSLGADSLDVVCVAVALEEVMGVDLHEGIEDGWQTVGDVVAAVEGVMA